MVSNRGGVRGDAFNSMCLWVYILNKFPSSFVFALLIYVQDILKDPPAHLIVFLGFAH